MPFDEVDDRTKVYYCRSVRYVCCSITSVNCWRSRQIPAIPFLKMFRFDTFPIFYWLPCCLLCFGLIWVTFRTRISDSVWLALSFGTLLLLRLPTLVYNREINPDESQMITQGYTLALDPIYFRSVDGTTIGPLDSYVLIIPSWIGIPYDYMSARVVAFILITLSLLFLYNAAKRWFGQMPARLALLPILFTLGLTQNGDLLSYCSELVPIFLLAIGTWLFSRIDTQTRPAYSILFLLGLLLGMVPLGKIQGAPVAVVLGLFAAVSLVKQPAVLFHKLSGLVALGVGALIMPGAFIAMAWANGLYNDFWLFYIEGNLLYGGNTNHWQNILNFPRHMAKGEEFGWLLTFCAVLTALTIVRYLTLSRPLVLSGRWAVRLGYIGFSLLAAFYAVTRTGTEFVHYFFFMVGPVFLLLALGWKMGMSPEGTMSRQWVPIMVTVVFLGLIVGKGALNYVRHIPLNLYPNDISGFSTPQPPIVQQIRKYAKAGEPLVVWGWRCDYYVSAKMPQGTAENHSERCVFESPMTSIYQQRYLNDFLRSVPPVFVDAVGNQNNWLTDRKTQGHEIIKPLADFVQAHYTYIGLYNDARLYVRKDRLNYVD